MTTVLVVDDQEHARRLLGDELREAGFSIEQASDGEEGWERFCRAGPDIVVTDMAMPRCDGIELLRRIRSRSDAPVIVFSGHGSIQSAAEAFKAGADEFVDSLDVDIDELVALVRQSAQRERKPPSSSTIEERIVGDSSAISRIRWQVAGLAPLSTPVLVSGEPGTGRSLVVETLHELGATASGTLRHFESESFTPADFADPGSIGAVHLRNVEALPTDAQRYWAHRLARDEKSSLAPTLRLLASSATPLGTLVETGRFDRNLARALLRFQVEMPPLRERPGDVPAIARALLDRIGRSVGRERIQLSPAALEFLERCRLPENIGQLERLLERGVAYTLGRVIRRDTLAGLLAELERTIAGMREEYQLHERDQLLHTLKQTGGNITHTAEILEKSRAAVYRLLAKYDIPLARRG